jgi:hypothetical protein
VLLIIDISKHGAKVSQFKANMAWMVLRWSTFKIMSCDPDLHPRWPEKLSEIRG